MRRAVTLLACLLAIAMAGCGSSSGTGGAEGSPGSGGTETPTQAAMSDAATQAPLAALPDPCSLLSKDEVSGVLGHAVQDGQPSTSNSCNWERTDVHFITADLHLLALPGTLPCQTGRSTPIDGLGVEAAWTYTDVASTGHVVACPGRLQVELVLVGDNATHTIPEAELQDKATQLMKLVLPRLP